MQLELPTFEELCNGRLTLPAENRNCSATLRLPAVEIEVRNWELVANIAAPAELVSERHWIMSTIGSSGLSPQVSSYAGALRAPADSDTARAASTQRSVDAAHHAYSDLGLHETAEAGRSGDRDANGFYGSDATKHGDPTDSRSPAAQDADRNAGTNSTPKLRPYDEHRGNLLDVQI